MIALRSLALLTTIALALPAGAADPVRNLRVKFAPGTTGAELQGHVEGRELVDYRLAAKAGQMVRINLATRSNSVSFNVFEPGKVPGNDAAFFIGATGGNTVEFRTAHSGDYLIRVLVNPAAARRNEAASYTLEVSAGGDASRAAPPRPDPADATVAGTDFQATGQIPCARDRGQPMGSCRYGVRRDGKGSGSITVSWPGGGNRVIFYEDNTPVRFDQSQADGDVKMQVGHEADLFHVRIGAQRFEIPLAVMTGG